ncbi:MAG: Crp/Fnr family transcriptional regulator [Bdellovibrionaceae bacterium]|jgi:CRP/FNR family transcriptional regulator, cyclic AMP receptor protein|nr:Crp/Fnr family transcriptional regulator [Pseudobdellovibrionaceae bacterium]
MAGVKIVQKGEYLFRENDSSDAMYVIKKGRLAITKAKGSKEIILAELGAGQMLGEMAFFDNKPRSAGAKAIEPTEAIALPFDALHAQFKTFPEWLRAMVKTVNTHLRMANQRIKNLENTNSQTDIVFPPHTITKLCAIISLMGFKSGVDEKGVGLVIPSHQLRNYTIQIFQQPTNKMTKLIDVLAEMQIMKTEDLGEGQIKTIILNHDLLTHFTDWYNKYLFAKEGDKVTVEERELPALHALIFYGEKVEEKSEDKVTINLTAAQNDSMKDLGHLFQATDVDTLIEKKLVDDKITDDKGNLKVSFDLTQLKTLHPFWTLIYRLQKVT